MAKSNDVAFLPPIERRSYLGRQSIASPRSGVLRRRGFTLIELLIVISIIALLATILFPVFARVRENARRTSCASNLKQIALGMTQYAQDFNERLPFAALPTSSSVKISDGTPLTACSGTSATCARIYWPDLLDPYAKSAKIFNDPVRANAYFSDCKWLAGASGIGTNCGSGASGLGPEPFKSRPWIYQGRLAATQNENGARRTARDGISYGYELSIGGAFNAQTSTPLSAFEYPSEKLLVAEAANYTVTLPSNGACGFLIPRHFDGVNVAFVDGHVKWLKWGFVCSDENTSEATQHLWFINGVS